MIESLFSFALKQQGLTIAGVVLVTLSLGSGVSQLGIDTSFNSLIPADEPDRLAYQSAMREFGSDNKTIIYIRDKDLWTARKLARVDELVKGLTELKQVHRVDSLFNLRIIEGTPDDQGNNAISSRPVLGSLPRDDVEALDARARAISNPLYIDNIFSDDGTATAIIVTVNDIEDQEDFSLAVYRQFESLINKERDQFEQIFQVGPPRINAELQQNLVDDFRLLGPLSAFVLVASILFFMRSTLAAVIPVITSALAIIWTFGFMGWLGIPLNILSAMVPSLIIVIGSTEDTHMMAAFFRGLADQSVSGGKITTTQRCQAVRYMARHTGLPMLLTVLTTFLGFAANLFGNITLITDFAIASTSAILFNGIITVFIVPPMLAKFGTRMGDGKSAGNPYSNDLPNQIIRTFRISQDRFPSLVLGLTLLLCSFFAYHASQLYVTNDPLSYFPEDRQLIKDTKTIHEDLAGIKVFFVTLEAETTNAFMDIENLQSIDRIQKFIDKQNVFDTTLSITDHLKYVNKEFQGDFSGGTLPQSRQLAAQYLMFFHRHELESYISHDFSRANIVVRHNISDSYTLNRHVRELRDFVDQITGSEVKAQVVGENLLVNKAADNLMLSQVQALILLLTLIFIIMSIMFTSLKGGAIAMIPSIIPISLMFGIMGALDIPINPGTAMVAVIAVGIAIDGTIHLLARYNELCRATSDYVGAVHQAVQEVATPLIISSLALALGFGILLFSNFTVVAQFGALAAATMLISIFANLLITPIIMTRIRLVGLYQILAIKVNQHILKESPLFAEMSNYERRKAILISELHEFTAGEKLISQGDIGRNMYMILDGTARVERRDGGETRVLADLNPGEIFGEVAYIRAIERTADVVATTDVSVLNFEYDRMQKDLRYFPNIVAKLNFNISGILGERLADVLDSGGQA